MAKFQEVMQEWGRMCRTFRRQPNGCTGCPLVDEHCYHELPFSYDPGCVERKVMAWAAEHPEPVYPMWRDWLRSQYPMMGPYTMTDILEAHIPADIAQKLGIEPKEG